MKRLILNLCALIALLLLLSRARAQEGLQIGLQAMPQLTSLRNQDDKSNKNFGYLPTAGYAYGIGAHFGFTEHAGVAFSLLYSVQGQRYRLHTVERYRKVEYMKVPLLFVNSIDIIKNLRFVYQVGPQFDILATARLLDGSGRPVASDQAAAYSKMGISGVLAAGLGISLAPRFILDIGVRYDYGFTNAEASNYGHNQIGTNGNGSNIAAARAITHNQTWGLLVGIRNVIGRTMD